MNRLIVALALCVVTCQAHAFSGYVQSCHDGDTCRLKTGQGVVKIRLAEIDAPEIDQPFGVEAQRIICAMICGRDVEVEERGTSYDRIVGLIRVQGIDTSEAMVRAGAAWDYVQYDSLPAIPALAGR